MPLTFTRRTIFAIISPYYKKPSSLRCVLPMGGMMKAIKRITALALCALMLLGLLSGCGEKKQGDEKFVLNVSVCNVIDSLDPAMNTDTDADSVFYLSLIHI